MNIYLFDELDKLDYGEFLHLLPPQRRLTLEKYKNELDKKLCAAAFLLLRMALVREYGIKTVPPITLGVHGKPYFAEKRSLFFNLSHCDAGAVCVVGQKENGVDIQDIRKIRESLPQKVFCTEELEYLKASKDKERSFAYLWSRKEAFVKLDGAGIAGNVLKNINALAMSDIKTQDMGNFFISAAPTKKISIIRADVIDFREYNQNQ